MFLGQVVEQPGQVATRVIADRIALELAEVQPLRDTPDECMAEEQNGAAGVQCMRSVCALAGQGAAVIAAEE